MTVLRSTLVGMRNGCRSARASLIREIENHLKPLRDSAPAEFLANGRGASVPYLGRMFDGLRDAIVDGKDAARIPLVDTRADDLSPEAAACVWTDCTWYLGSKGLACDRLWQWHDESRRSGIVTLVVTL